jgi:ribosomal protein L7Ae-like RNA K-turn-binding protein
MRNPNILDSSATVVGLPGKKKAASLSHARKPAKPTKRKLNIQKQALYVWIKKTFVEPIVASAVPVAPPPPEAEQKAADELERRKQVYARKLKQKMQRRAKKNQRVSNLEGPEFQLFCVHLANACHNQNIIRNRARRCEYVITPHINALATKMITNLYALQLKALQNPNKMKALKGKRVVFGLSHTLKSLKAGTIKCAVVAANIVDDDSSGGLNDLVDSIVAEARKRKVPVVFALKLESLGKIVSPSSKKPKKISAVGVLSTQGAHAEYKELALLIPQEIERLKMYQHDTLVNPQFYRPFWEVVAEHTAALEARAASTPPEVTVSPPLASVPTQATASMNPRALIFTPAAAASS